MTLEQLEIEKEETEQYGEKLNKVRQGFIQQGIINELELPIDEMIEFRRMVLTFLDSKIAIGEQLQEEIEGSIAFYNTA